MGKNEINKLVERKSGGEGQDAILDLRHHEIFTASTYTHQREQLFHDLNTNSRLQPEFIEKQRNGLRP